jgi:glycerate-2-kinase
MFKNRDIIIKNGATPSFRDARDHALSILENAISSVNPYNLIKNNIPNESTLFGKQLSDFNNIYLVSFGKASVAMTKAILEILGNKIKKGVVITNDPAQVKYLGAKNIEIFVGSHPLPDEKNLHNTEKVLELLHECNKNDLLIVLISGGSSSLLCKPRIPLKDLKIITDLLLKSGADIKEINTVRKHLSFVKGGQLAKQTKATIISLVLSDIVGDPIEFIASGPTAPDSTTYNDAKRVLEEYSIWNKAPESVRNVIGEGIKGSIPETPKENDPVFERVYNIIVGNNELACKKAAEKAEEFGYEVRILNTGLTGEARNVGEDLAYYATILPYENRKIALISGGETTVTVKGKGKGGRNQEMVLAASRKIEDENIVFTSIATDGIDGNSDAAGAIADGNTIRRAKEKNMKPEEYLENNDSYSFFKKLNDLLICGSTGTNVMDIQLILIF